MTALSCDLVGAVLYTPFVEIIIWRFMCDCDIDDVTRLCCPRRTLFRFLARSAVRTSSPAASDAK